MRQKNENAHPIFTLFVHLVLIFLAFLCLFFFYILLINSTRNHFDIQKGFSFLPGTSFVSNFKKVMADANIPVLSGIKNSLIVSSASAILATYFSALTAYGLYAYDFKLKKPAFVFIMLILAMPTQVSALGFVRLVDRMHMMNTLWPLFLPSIAAPAVFYFMYSYIQSSLPMELVEAARMDGATRFQVFRKVIMPLAKPIVIYTILSAFMAPWGDFIFARYIAHGSSAGYNVAVGLWSWTTKTSVGTQYTMFCAGGVLVALPITILFMILQRYYVEGVTGGAVKG